MSSRDYFIRVEWTQELDPDRINEWVRANINDDAQVQINDKETGEYVYTR